VPVAAAGNLESEKTKTHPHAFVRDGDDTIFVRVEVDGSAGKDALVARAHAGIRGLLVMKSTGSAFEGFVRDEYTTLGEVDDRIFSTAVDLTYEWAEVTLPAPTVRAFGTPCAGGTSPDWLQDEKKLEWAMESAGAGDVWDGPCPWRPLVHCVSRRHRRRRGCARALGHTRGVRDGRERERPGDALQDGAAAAHGERPRAAGDVRAAQQTLHPCRPPLGGCG
jgi:hypothetical protein